MRGTPQRNRSKLNPLFAAGVACSAVLGRWPLALPVRIKHAITGTDLVPCEYCLSYLSHRDKCQSTPNTARPEPVFSFDRSCYYGGEGSLSTPKMKTHNAKLLVQAGHAEDATKTFMTPYQQMMTAVVRPDNWLWVESRGDGGQT